MDAPLEIIFYDADDQEIARYSRNRIPSYLLDMAIDLGHVLGNLNLDQDKPAAELTAPLFDFIVELFGNKFSRDELKKNTDLIECMAVYRAVLARAQNIVTGFAKGNPIPPSPKKK